MKLTRRYRWRPARRSALLTATLATALALVAGCSKGDLRLDLQVFAADRPLAETFRAIDSHADEMDCTVTGGAANIYSVTRYQWARLHAMALQGNVVRRTLAHQSTFLSEDDHTLALTTADGGTLDVSLCVTPDSCCTWMLQNVEFALRGVPAGGAVRFYSMWPVVRNILVELVPPRTAGSARVWILMDIEEVNPNAPKPDPR